MYGFRTEEDLRRVINAVRVLERLKSSPDDLINSGETLPSLTASPTFVQLYDPVTVDNLYKGTVFERNTTDESTTEEWIEGEEVRVVELNDEELEIDIRYFGMLVGFMEHGTSDNLGYPIVVVQKPGGTSASTGLARLTTASSGKWKFVKLKLDSGSHAYVDDGVEILDFTAVPSTIDGVSLCNPVADLRVIYWPSASDPGYYEFLPIGMTDGTNSYPGLVSIVAQTIKGVKTFLDNIIGNMSVAVNATSLSDSSRSNTKALTIKSWPGTGSSWTSLSTNFPTHCYQMSGGDVAGGTGGEPVPPFAAYGDYTIITDRTNNRFWVTPIFDPDFMTYSTGNLYGAHGVPLSVSGYVVTPEVRIQYYDDLTFDSYCSLFATDVCHSYLNDSSDYLGLPIVRVSGVTSDSFGMHQGGIQFPPGSSRMIAIGNDILPSVEFTVPDWYTTGGIGLRFKHGMLYQVSNNGTDAPAQPPYSKSALTTLCGTGVGAMMAEMEAERGAVMGTKKPCGCGTCLECDPESPRPVRIPVTDFRYIPEPNPSFIEEFQNKVKEFESVPYPQDKYHGRGIIIPAGGWGQLPGVYVTAKMLRWVAVNCRLPIEVWYIGDEGEYDPAFDHLTAGLNIKWKNISEELRKQGIKLNNRLYGWAIKPLAVMLSSFSEVFMLDSDCYPVYDPERLLDDSRLTDQPAIFWPDNQAVMEGGPLTADQWALFGMEAPDHPIPGFESGQMYVNKEKSWPAVQLAAWMADRMEEFDSTREKKGGFYGDKEIFSVAWRAMSVDYHLMKKAVRYHQVAFLQHDVYGDVVFVHRCNDKPRISFQELRAGTQRLEHGQFKSFGEGALPHEHMFHRYLEELKFKVRPNIPGFRDGTQDQQIWNEVHIANTYRLPKRIDGWTVIDVGAHAGFFTLEALTRGASRVVSVEPYRPNNETLRLNLTNWIVSDKVSVVYAALAPKGTDEVLICGSENGTDRTGEPYVGKNGTPVKAVSLDELLSKYDKVDYLKMDAEGAEWICVPDCTSWEKVDRIGMEWHGTTYGRKSPQEIVDILKRNGFVVEVTENQPGAGIGMLYARKSKLRNFDNLTRLKN